MGNYIKHFHKWSAQKQKLDQNDSKRLLYFKAREVWWVSIGVNVGVEIDGKHDSFERPVLVLRKINRQQCYGFPLTSKEKSGDFYFPVTYGKSAGTVCLSQLRVFDIKRFRRKIDIVPEPEFRVLQTKIANFLAGKGL